VKMSNRIRYHSIDAAVFELLMTTTCKVFPPMDFRVVLIKSEEGWAASCPALRGCHSQGDSREEALANIREAIREWLDAEADEAAVFSVIEETVSV